MFPAAEQRIKMLIDEGTPPEAAAEDVLDADVANGYVSETEVDIAWHEYAGFAKRYFESGP